MTITAERTDMKEKIARKHLAPTPFHTYEWLSTLEKTLSLDPRIITFTEGKKMLGWIPVFEKKMGITVQTSPAFGTETAYGGIVSEHPELLYPLLKGNFFIIHPAKLTVPGCICEPKYTILTPLTGSAEEHFKKLKKGHRYNISKALRDKELTVKEEYSDKSLATYYSLLQETYAYHKFKPLPLAFYKEIITHLHKEGRVKLLVAYHHDKPVGTICALIHNQTLYYWTGAFLRISEVSKLYPNDLLQWHIIQWGYERKIPVYDMLGGDIPGIRDFKLGFGGELVEYTKIFSSKKLHLLSKAYGKLGEGVKKVIRGR